MNGIGIKSGIAPPSPSGFGGQAGFIKAECQKRSAFYFKKSIKFAGDPHTKNGEFESLFTPFATTA